VNDLSSVQTMVPFPHSQSFTKVLNEVIANFNNVLVDSLVHTPVKTPMKTPMKNAIKRPLQNATKTLGQKLPWTPNSINKGFWYEGGGGARSTSNIGIMCKYFKIHKTIANVIKKGSQMLVESINHMHETNIVLEEKQSKFQEANLEK